MSFIYIKITLSQGKQHIVVVEKLKINTYLVCKVLRRTRVPIFYLLIL